MIASTDDAIKFLEHESEAYNRRAETVKARNSFDCSAQIYEDYAKSLKSLIHLLEHYKKIREIVSQWGADYYDQISKAEYFDKILETFEE